MDRKERKVDFLVSLPTPQKLMPWGGGWINPQSQSVSSRRAGNETCKSIFLTNSTFKLIRKNIRTQRTRKTRGVCVCLISKWSKLAVLWSLSVVRLTAPEFCNKCNINELLKAHYDDGRVNQNLLSSPINPNNLPSAKCLEELFSKPKQPQWLNLISL